jgi:hypothetical protein
MKYIPLIPLDVADLRAGSNKDTVGPTRIGFVFLPGKGIRARFRKIVLKKLCRVCSICFSSIIQLKTFRLFLLMLNYCYLLQWKVTYRDKI